MENRSFDTIFGKLNDYRAANGLPRDVDGLPDDCDPNNSDWTKPCGAMNMAPDANGTPTTPIYAFHLKTSCIENTSADWIVSHWAFNAEDPTSTTPKMDGFVIGAASAANGQQSKDTQGIRAMGFYTSADLGYHYWLATNFATSDRWYSPAPTRTQPSRYFMVAATGGGRAYETQSAINAKTIFDLLDAKGITWKIYTQDGWTSASAFAGFMTRFGSHVLTDPGYAQFKSDAASGNLPQVAYLEQPKDSEHPGLGDPIQGGEQVSKDVVSSVMFGPSWKDSVVIVTFDEGGGIYDHVPPPTNVPSPDGIKPIDICTNASDSRCALAAKTHTAPPYDPDDDFVRYGFRVPLMVVSPWTKPGYVSHTVTDYTAWMHFVETRFGLPNLNNRDAAASNMLEFFDFSNPHWATPPQNAPGITNGACYDGLP